MKQLRLDPKNVIKLGPKAWDELMKILDAPPKPNKALLAAARKYRDEIRSGKLVSTPAFRPPLTRKVNTMNIYKYIIPHKSRSVVPMPAGAKITHVAPQTNAQTGEQQICAWALVPENVESDCVDVKFQIVGTGGKAPAGYTYAGILILHETQIIQHVFFDSSAPVSKI